MATSDIDQTIEQYHQALDEIIKGNAEPNAKIFSQRDDVSLANPLGPTVRGRKQVVETMERAASFLRDGQPTSFENTVKVVTPDLAFIVETERTNIKLGGRQDFAPVALRVTTIFRREDGVWKVVHRHADPIVSIQPLESIIQK
jgi:uncharacterized protein (TIGR02246 family)